MGRQMSLFMLNGDVKEFIELVKASGDTVVDDKGNPLTVQEALDSTQVFIISTQSRIVRDDNGFIIEDFSDVIEFSRSISYEPRHARFGRLWVKLDYWGENGEKIRKEKWLNDKYNAYKKWILKNCKLSKNKHFYIGKAAYRLYKEEGYKMMSSPMDEVEFE